MESYIIHISRRDMNDLNNLVGLVEIVGYEEKKPFRNIAELLEILNSSKNDV